MEWNEWQGENDLESTNDDDERSHLSAHLYPLCIKLNFGEMSIRSSDWGEKERRRRQDARIDADEVLK